MEIKRFLKIRRREERKRKETLFWSRKRCYTIKKGGTAENMSNSLISRKY
jgi:hypothetical protein